MYEKKSYISFFHFKEKKGVKIFLSKSLEI